MNWIWRHRLLGACWVSATPGHAFLGTSVGWISLQYCNLSLNKVSAWEEATLAVVKEFSLHLAGPLFWRHDKEFDSQISCRVVVLQGLVQRRRRLCLLSGTILTRLPQELEQQRILQDKQSGNYIYSQDFCTRNLCTYCKYIMNNQRNLDIIIFRLLQTVRL